LGGIFGEHLFAEGADVTLPDTIALVQRSVVQIACGWRRADGTEQTVTPVGTGFFVEPSLCWLVTAKHVIRRVAK
jgi:hypothetical protein